MLNVLLVGAGGFIGSVLRYLVAGLVRRLIPASIFPAGTLAVNAAGCVLIGFLAGVGERCGVIGTGTRLFALVGLMGGFTTFSAFSGESYQLWEGGRQAAAALNVGLHLAVGLGGVGLGLAAARLLACR